MPLAVSEPCLLLALLPPPPAQGWPAEFGLARLAAQLEARARLETLFRGHHHI